ncbi:MAG: hypothetical protein PUE17_07585 [Bacteroidales bacterium]|nr:hypothetical protein [Bacteroidales bacterium]
MLWKDSARREQRKEKPQDFIFFAEPQPIFAKQSSVRRAQRKAVQGERKGNKKRKFFKMPFPNRSRLYVKAAGFYFRSVLSLHCFCPLGATRLGLWITRGAAPFGRSAPGCGLLAPLGRSLTALNFYRTATNNNHMTT